MMQVAPEDIWDPNDPHKYYTPIDMGDNFIFLEKTSKIKAKNNGGEGEHDEDMDPHEEDKVGVYVLLETDDGKVTVAPAKEAAEQEGASSSKVSSPKTSQKYSCPICDFVTDKDDLEDHVASSHMGSGEFRCSLCEYATGEKVDLLAHMESVHNDGGGEEDTQELLDDEEDEAPSKGDIVDEAADLLPGSNCHLEAVEMGVDDSWEKEVFKRCPRCPYSSPEESDMRAHILSVHLDYLPFACIEGGDCKFAAATKAKLVAHMINAHSMAQLEAREDIDQREFDLSLPEDLELHMADTDMTNMTDLASTDSAPLGQGLKRKAEDSSVTEFKTEPSIDEKTDGDGRLACDLCPYSAFKEASLERHKRSAHSGDGSGKVWVCSECEFVSGSRYEYLLHSDKEHSG